VNGHLTRRTELYMWQNICRRVGIRFRTCKRKSVVTVCSSVTT